jgi:ribose transport system substrate-binding protein
MKKVLITIIALCMLVSLAACASGTKPAVSADNQPSQAQAGTDAATTPEAPGTGKSGGWRIAFSNSYVGNAWRTACVNIFDAYGKSLVEQGVIAEYYSSSAGNDVQAQINEVRNMMSEGYDAILCIAASETGLNSVLEEAAERGIVVVCFDANVDSDLVYNVNTDQIEYGRLLAQSLADRMNGKGNILWIKGIEGNAVTIARSEGMQGVLDNYPDIKVLGTAFGMWDDSTTAVEMAKLMSAYSDMGIDGILSEGGGGHAIVESLIEYGYDVTKMPIAEGEMFNSFMKDWVEMGLDAFTTAQPPYLSAAAMDVAIKVLNGEKVDKWTYIDLPTCSSVDEAKEKWYQPDQDGNFICDWTDNKNTWNLSVEAIFGK